MKPSVWETLLKSLKRKHCDELIETLHGSCVSFLALFRIEARCIGQPGLLFEDSVSNLFILSFPTDETGGLFDEIFERHF